MTSYQTFLSDQESIPPFLPQQRTGIRLCRNLGRLLPRLESEIDRLIAEENVRYFYVGGYGGFDQIAATAVKRVKKKYPEITLMLVLPYHPAERSIEKPPGYDQCH